MALGGQRGWGSPSVGRGARRARPEAWLQGAAGHCFLGRSSRQAGVTGGAPGAGGRLFIARAARVTEPGRADGAADALGRGAEGAGCARAATMGRSARLPGLRGPLFGPPPSAPRPLGGGRSRPWPRGSARRSALPAARPDSWRSWSRAARPLRARGTRRPGAGSAGQVTCTGPGWGAGRPGGGPSPTSVPAVARAVAGS